MLSWTIVWRSAQALFLETIESGRQLSSSYENKSYSVLMQSIVNQLTLFVESTLLQFDSRSPGPSSPADQVQLLSNSKWFACFCWYYYCCLYCRGCPMRERNCKHFCRVIWNESRSKSCLKYIFGYLFCHLRPRIRSYCFSTNLF